MKQRQLTDCDGCTLQGCFDKKIEMADQGSQWLSVVAATLGVMGSLMYGAEGSLVEFDDRTLAHLQVVIVAKLRRLECFTLSYQREDAGRESLWVHPSIPLRFQFTGIDIDRGLNRVWVQELADLASRGDLRVIAEPA